MTLLLLVKIFVSVAMVLGLTLIAERASPRIAGILSGYPLGVALALFFVGVENGARFAAQSAVYTAAGFTASLVLVYVYHWTIVNVKRHQVLAASSVALAAFVLVAAVLQRMPFGLWSGALLTGGAILFFHRRLGHIANVTIDQRIRLTFLAFLVRALAAAAMVLVITGLARMIGERWTGVFSAFPITLFPLLVILHLTYGPAQVQTIIKNFPAGMGSLLTYVVAVAMSYPRYGVAMGTLLSFLLATGYLVALFVVANLRVRSD